MNPPHNDNENNVRLIQLDRLAAGDLTPAARRELFNWLDADPDRWHSALVLLEARELAQVFGDWKSETPKTASVATAMNSHPKRNTSNWLLLAVCLFAAFGLGMGMNHIYFPHENRLVEDLKQRGDADTKLLDPHLDQHSDDADTPKSSKFGERPENERHQQNPLIVASDSRFANNVVIPEYVRSQLERRGYRIDSQPSVVSVALPNGDNVELPINHVQFSYVGQQSY